MTGGGHAPLIVRLVPVGLTVAAEAAWIAILGGLLQEYSLRNPVLGIAELGAFVLIGVVAATLIAPRLRPERWAIVAVGIVGAGAVLGILASPDSRAALADPTGGLAAALAHHPGGLVAGLATFRGFRHAQLPLDEDALRHLFAGGAAAAVFGALAGTLVAEPWRDRFLGDTLGLVVVFAVSAVLGLALTRQLAAEQESRERWTPNTSWIGLIAIVVAITGLAVVPASTIASPLVELTAYLLLASLLIVGAIVGWTRQTVTGLIAFVVVVVLLGTLVSGAPKGATPGSSGAGAGAGAGADGGPGGSAAVSIPIWLAYGLAILVAALVVGALAWRWARDRRYRPAGAVIETRFIDRSRGNEAPRPGPGWLARLGIHLSPGDAAAAYVALIRDLSGKVGVERDPAETPREHAHRLRTSGTPTLGLELLAADYALVRFGGGHLTPREQRRGVDRWRSLRLRLSARSEEIVATAAAIELEKLDRGRRFERTMTGAAQPGDAPPTSDTPHG
jgi:hypothetical protein